MSRRAEALAMRAKILGVLLKDARLAAGKSIKECADILNCPVSAYTAYELGHKSPSLPELEIIAFCLDTPLSHFWGNTVLSESERNDASQLPRDELTGLRDRIIGAQLRKARTSVRIKLKDIAGELGISSVRLSAYEFGEKPMPLPELEALVARLGLSMEDLLETQRPVGESGSPTPCWAERSAAAAEKFAEAARACEAAGDRGAAAELRNNQCVAHMAVSQW